MTELDITFEDAPWEQALEALNPGDTASGAWLLALMEEADEEQLQQVLCRLREKHISVDIADLPALPAGEAAVRLSQEQKLAKSGGLLSDLSENDPLRLYLEELAAIPAAGDADILARQVLEGDVSAREKLLNLLLSRTVSAALDYTGKGVLLLDLIQEAGLGLWESLLCYEGGDICSHCDWWIGQYLAGAVLLQARAGGVGQHLRQTMEDYRAMDEALLAQLGRNPTVEEIAQALHISPEETQTVADMVQSARVLQHAKQPEPEQLPQEEDQAVEDTAYFQMRQRIEELLSGLSREDAKLLTLRYGLEGGLPMDPAQVGIRLGMTAQEVINREAAALAKLRQ